MQGRVSIDRHSRYQKKLWDRARCLPKASNHVRLHMGGLEAPLCTFVSKTVVFDTRYACGQDPQRRSSETRRAPALGLSVHTRPQSCGLKTEHRLPSFTNSARAFSA